MKWKDVDAEKGWPEGYRWECLESTSDRFTVWG